MYLINIFKPDTVLQTHHCRYLCSFSQLALFPNFCSAPLNAITSCSHLTRLMKPLKSPHDLHPTQPCSTGEVEPDWSLTGRRSREKREDEEEEDFGIFKIFPASSPNLVESHLLPPGSLWLLWGG